jgi:hypothetical protein
MNGAPSITSTTSISMNFRKCSHLSELPLDCGVRTKLKNNVALANSIAVIGDKILHVYIPERK